MDDKDDGEEAGDKACKEEKSDKVLTDLGIIPDWFLIFRRSLRLTQSLLHRFQPTYLPHQVL